MTSLPSTARTSSKISAETGLALGMIGIIAVMILPLPALLLDALLAISITVSLVVFLFSLHIEKPLEFSAFPSLLLLTTLFRLALNLATTRLILLHGHEGKGAAGHVLEAFAQFVVGGNLVVGVVIFLILVVINFVVITKGAGRIAEVGARFTLDAMPGKQMAIDADLAAGLIKEDEARRRRKAVEQEADFFGSMDGASKFVRGDAVAGLLITAVNLFGGLIIGVAQRNMSLSSAASAYSQLTIGDGLVTQLPALLTSIAAGLVTTRAAAGGALGAAVKKQLFGSDKALRMAAAVLAGLALVPGMPHVAFAVIAVALFMVSRNQVPEAVPAEAAPVRDKALEERQELEQKLSVDLLEIEVGLELVPLVDEMRDGGLMRRIAGIRKQLASELGIIVPPIHMRDNLRLAPGAYRVLLSGNEIGKGELRLGHVMAMTNDPAGVTLPGENVLEPAFGLPAKWIAETDRDRAEFAGYTVVEPATVVATHLGELLASHAHEILGRRELQELLELAGRDNGKLIEELVPQQITHVGLLKILRGLLRERLSIRDLRGVLEGIAEHIHETKDVDQLVEHVRVRLSRQITGRHRGRDGSVYAILLAPDVEGSFRRMQQPQGGFDPAELSAIGAAFEHATKNVKRSEELPVILVAGDIRRSVATFAARHTPGLSVVSYREIDPQAAIRTLAIVGANRAAELKGTPKHAAQNVHRA